VHHARCDTPDDFSKFRGFSPSIQIEEEQIMSGSKKAKVSQLAALQAIKTGLQKYYANKTLPIAGKAWKQADLVALVQDQIDNLNASDSAHAAWVRAAASAHTGEAAVSAVVPGIRGIVAGMYGSSSEAYTDFGFTPPRKGKPSSKTKAAAVDQTLATRAARHIMGKNQRLAIPSVTVTPAASEPGAGSPSSTPQSAPTSATTTGAPSTGSTGK
jgi:hypothetical protein